MPAFSDVRIFMTFTSLCRLATGDARDDPGSQEPQTTTPAFTDMRIFMTLTPSRNRRVRGRDDPPVVRNRLRPPHDRAGFHRCANLHDAYLLLGIGDARGRRDPGCSERVSFPKRHSRLSQTCESSWFSPFVESANAQRRRDPWSGTDSVSPDDRADLHRGANLHRLTPSPPTTRF
jgi:hypothetical protein